MDTEDEMIEEHLDEEYQNSEIEDNFSEMETQIEQLQKQQKDHNLDDFQRDKLEKAITMLRLHVQNYQRIVLFNRRRSQQRLKKRQNSLRNFFLKTLMETQIRYVEMIPLALQPHELLVNSCNDLDKRDITFVQSSPVSQEKKIGTNINTNAPKASSLSYYKDVALKFTNNQWLEAFHIPKEIFDLICTRLKPFFSYDSKRIDYESLIAMNIYAFANGGRFADIALLFKVDKLFVKNSLRKFSVLLLTGFSQKKLSMPKNKTELEDIAYGFFRASRMTPCVAGVLCLFELPNLCECGRYKNTCGTKALKVQICVDNRLLFRKIETSTKKASMFLKAPNEVSMFWKKFSDNSVLPYFIVAPPGYPLRTWLMQTYNNPCQPWEYDFNKCFGSLNIYREVALKRLFGRFNILNTTECLLPQFKELIIKACCLLHNMLEENREYFSVEWCKNFKPEMNEKKMTASATMFYNDCQKAFEKRDGIAKLIRLAKIQNIDKEFRVN